MPAKTKKPRKIFKYIFRGFLILFLIMCCITGFLIGKAYTWVLEAKKYLPSDNQLQAYSSLNTYVYDNKGRKIDQFNGGTDRDWVDINSLPDYAKNSFVAIEDERFYTHNGVDFKRMIGALIANLRKGDISQGGSTITQQYIKNTIFATPETIADTSFKRKVQEQYLAIQFEKKFSKEQILQAYLNTINLGHSAYGIGAAAKIYFGKKAKNLTVAQSAVLASLPQAPNFYDPYGTHFDACIKRQKVVLKKMLQQGYITPSEYSDALLENIKSELKSGKTYSKKIHSYFVEEVISQVKQKLKEKGLNPELVYTGGLKIYTTLDQDIQNRLDTTFNTPGLFPTLGTDSKGIVQPQSGMVILDYHNGEVKALIGGRGKKTANLVFDRATDALRQPGSSIKPLGVYAPAIDKLGYTEDSKIDDTPFSVGNYTPSNIDHSFMGIMTYRRALALSRNVPAVKILEEVGHETSFDYLTNRFRLKTIDKEKDKWSASGLALGGLTYGVSVYDMTAAYGAIANKGVYVTPHTFTEVRDSDNKVLIDNKPKADRILKQSTAIQLTDMMSSVITEGTGSSARFTRIQMPEAGKTGTTSNLRDKWFVGYTPYYSAALWVGFDDPQPMNINLNSLVAAWKTIMENVHEGLPYIDFFNIPSGVASIKPDGSSSVSEKDYIKVKVCSESGLKAGPWCPPELIKERIYEMGTQPTEYCNIHGPSQDSSNDNISSESTSNSSTSTSEAQNEEQTSTQSNTSSADNKTTSNSNSGSSGESNISNQSDSLNNSNSSDSSDNGSVGNSGASQADNNLN